MGGLNAVSPPAFLSPTNSTSRRIASARDSKSSCSRRHSSMRCIHAESTRIPSRSDYPSCSLLIGTLSNAGAHRRLAIISAIGDRDLIDARFRPTLQTRAGHLTMAETCVAADIIVSGWADGHDARKRRSFRQVPELIQTVRRP
jgi:hypothetical protein